MTPSFPFSAIVGQETLKRALLLAVIQPSLGGVLVRGTKGVAKSTAVRALATLLPPIEVVAGCPFQRRPGETIADWPLPADAPTGVRPVPLVELPLGATEDRVLGALHLERALRGERAFEPGLLAAANRGLLYIDEVNLLPDHLVDILLDAAASGVHRVEREGLSLWHPARFVLIGTMNPEEGDLRPQLLDRFGLVVDVSDLADAADRAEVVRRRLAYEAEPAGFVAAWESADTAEAQRIVQAQRLLSEVHVPDSVLRAISARCLAAGVEGLRADLTLCKAASAWAAYQGRILVDATDLDAVAEFALGHRRTQPPDGGGSGADKHPSSRDDNAASRPNRDSIGLGQPAREAPEVVLESSGLFAPRVRPATGSWPRPTRPGRWRGPALSGGSMASGALRPYEEGAALSWAATLRAAALRQTAGEPVAVGPEDLRGWPPRGPAGCLLFFVVDASGSMAAWRRMRQTKAAVLALLLQAYQRRDRMALLAFRGTGAGLVLPPTASLRRARQALEALPVGGTTPLAHGLAAAGQFLRRQRRRQPGLPVWTVLLTDGRTNVGFGSGVRSQAGIWHDALIQARILAACATECLVVDTETGWPRFGGAGRIAAALGARCLPLEEVLGRRLSFRLPVAQQVAPCRDVG
jgi:magnesium chelatase subunit D